MRIALLGYGKMGKEIEKTALSRNHEVVLKIDETNPQDVTRENLIKADAAIDFSIPKAAYNNINSCFDADLPIVCGTTGWLDKYDKIAERCNKENKTFFYASNYSFGVNVLFYLNEKLAEIMNSHPEFEVNIEETHHTQKLDAPSGTAISLANGLIKKLERKSKWQLDNSDEQVVCIKAHRIENVFGIHNVKYESDIDKITISHEAKNRKGFALGAVLAAEFIHDKIGAFGMKDLLGF
ncbi:MAG: 4-hydroxy-tetrahydrodipicolinate reductase [Bacteroidetes bacterium]|jgi:4-hydroxy-tetrahydrodipicolinate reductase|nr:4-hydroxy-tetrahydrodipicolinate reductase [Bacteroidota bacterium]